MRAFRPGNAQNLAALLAAVCGAWAFGYVVGAAARLGANGRTALLPVACLLALTFAVAAGWVPHERLRRRLRRLKYLLRQQRRAQAGAVGAEAVAPVAPAGAASLVLQARSHRRVPALATAPMPPSRAQPLLADAALPQATDALLRVLAQVLAPCQVGLFNQDSRGQLAMRASQPGAQDAAAWPEPVLAHLRQAVGPPGRAGLHRPGGASAVVALGKVAADVRIAPILEATRDGGRDPQREGRASQGHVWGLLAVLRPQPVVWSQADVALVEGVAAQLALAWGLEQALRISRRHLQRLERIATTDGLTELVNQRHFAKLFDLQLARARRYNRRLSLIFLDIDHFKAVNDTHGHQAGDDVLKKVAQVLRGTARCTDTVARLGGEEFAILMEETGAKGAERYAERIRQALSREVFTAQGGAFSKTCSLGVATFPEHGEDAKDLMARADEALYFAKRTGRNRTVIYRADATTRESSS